jgi:hypothetical protein
LLFTVTIAINFYFTNDEGRCLVNLTRATDASIIIGQPSSLDRLDYDDIELDVHQRWGSMMRRQTAAVVCDGGSLKNHRQQFSVVDLNDVAIGSNRHRRVDSILH